MELEEGGETGDGWKSIKSPSVDVDMYIKYFRPKKGERSVGTGRAVGIIDCSAEEAAANLIDYCSRQRMCISQEEGNPARILVENNAALNEATFATVKVMPLLLKDREFIVKMIWKADEAGVTLAFESVDLDVDYGVSLNTVRGRTRALYRIENLPLAIKTLGLVLLSVVSLDYVAVFFATDIGSYLLIKIVHGDFIYWVRLKGLTGILVSLIMRVTVKVVTDFINVVQFRHPNEVGGAQWVFGQFISVATLFIALYLAETSSKLDDKMDILWQISCAPSPPAPPPLPSAHLLFARQRHPAPPSHDLGQS